ncbi:MAG: ATP-dependent Clp protease ATP-binding subunit [Paludibacteraceae bacterium]|nr:ATP-dependent Clp protease ATP-binding subunit [Paludibacteraceae bacterium]
MLTVRLNKILTYAREEAERLQNTLVQPEHLLLGILRLGEGQAYSTLHELGWNETVAKQQLDSALAGPPSDLLQPAQRSAQVERILRVADSEAKLTQAQAVGSIHLLMAILHEHINRAAAYLESAWGITYDQVLERQRNGATVKNAAPMADDVADAPEQERPKQFGKQRSNSATPMLDKYGRDLTAQAKEGLLDPVVGRDLEIERVMQILSRRKKNNPILIGEPGVGKSAIVEGLALRVIRGEVPALTGKRIVTLDIASMVAGTTYRGQFEERMKKLIEEMNLHKEIILFIDEIHTIIGAGNAQGSLDAANILKPALARGEVQCIGATTIEEYRKSVEKDGALERRFQKVMVAASTLEQTMAILQQLQEQYGSYHHVHYTKEALRSCVLLADRYLTDRAFPDKAIDVMDEAGARKHSQNQVVDITAEDIASVVAMMSGVPVQRVQSEEQDRLRDMAVRLKTKVIGQNEAVDTVVKAIQRSRLGLRDPKRPIGSFFFLGPTGVGKTYLAQCLAEEMFGSKDAVIRFDMSEYAEKHTASLLVGAPPGYVAYEDGGKLTEAVRRKPYSIVLFDEIEKAHPDIFNIMLQVLDEGRLTDRQGRIVDFKNTIIILTSNVGTRQLKEFGGGVGFTSAIPDEKTAKATLLKALDKTFPPEFVNRIDQVVTFNNLTPEALRSILDLELMDLHKRLKEQHIKLDVSEQVKVELLQKTDFKQFGARPIRRSIQTYLEDRITEKMLSKRKIRTINIKSL